MNRLRVHRVQAQTWEYRSLMPSGDLEHQVTGRGVDVRKNYFADARFYRSRDRLILLSRESFVI